MARSDLLAGFMKAAVSNDKNKIIQIGEAIIAEEREKKHNVLANRLASILRENGALSNRTGRMLQDVISSLTYEITPEIKISDLFLSKGNETLLDEVINEYQRKELLKTYGLAPRNRLMFVGAPGNGKTSLAEGLAYALMLPLVVVRYEGLIGSYLGETASRLDRIFEYARQHSCLLFFDEFDTIGKERGDKYETGEIKRVVSSLLMQVDRLPSYTVVVVASNHPQLLDSAAWRRFQVRIELGPPTQADIKRYLEMYKNKTNLDFGMSLATIVKKIQVHSYAELEEFCRDVLRRSILSKFEENAKTITERKITQWAARYKTKVTTE